MAYTQDTQEKNEVTWDSNPSGSSTATIVDGVLTELSITNENGVRLVYTVDIAMLGHIKQVITDIESILAV